MILNIKHFQKIVKILEFDPDPNLILIFCCWKCCKIVNLSSAHACHVASVYHKHCRHQSRLVKRFGVASSVFCLYHLSHVFDELLLPKEEKNELATPNQLWGQHPLASVAVDQFRIKQNQSGAEKCNSVLAEYDTWISHESLFLSSPCLILYDCKRKGKGRSRLELQFGSYFLVNIN